MRLLKLLHPTHNTVVGLGQRSVAGKMSGNNAEPEVIRLIPPVMLCNPATSCISAFSCTDIADDLLEADDEGTIKGLNSFFAKITEKTKGTIVCKPPGVPSNNMCPAPAGETFCPPLSCMFLSSPHCSVRELTVTEVPRCLASVGIESQPAPARSTSGGGAIIIDATSTLEDVPRAELHFKYLLTLPK